jgi:hypothetical protein
MTAPTSELQVRTDLSPTQALTRQGYTPQTLDDLRQICSWIAKSRLAPRGFDTPEKVFIGCQTAMEAGLPMLTGLRMMYIVHNVPSWVGKGALALIRSSGACDQPPILRYEGEGKQLRAIWKFKRKDMPQPVEVDYTWEQAVKAGYDRKEGAWQSDPKGMLGWRACSRMADRYFSDVLCGLPMMEEVRDWPPEAFDRIDGGEAPGGEAGTEPDPLMAGAGEPAAQTVTTHDSLPAEPVPATSEIEDAEVVADAEAGVEIECPHCGAVHLYGAASDFACLDCGADVREEPEPTGEEATHHAPITFTPALLVKMLGRLGVKVTQKVVKEWTEPQQAAAYDWAYDEQMVRDAAEAKVDYDRTWQGPPPEFLPIKAEPKPTPATPEPEVPEQVSEFSTMGGSCITTRQAGVLRGMAQNRCTELGLKEADARFKFVTEALGCKSEQVTEDRYEEAKEQLKVFAPEF